MTPRVVVIGDLTIDDVVHPDGTTEMATVGGDVLYAALGAHLWEPCVGMVTRCGEDFPRRSLEPLSSLGIALDGVVNIKGPTVRNWIIYEDDGRRHWAYRTPPERSVQVAVRPEDIPATWLDARPALVVHVAAMPIAAAETIVEAVRRAAPSARITLDTHEDYVRGYQDRLLRLARQVDAFLPSREELADLVGFDDPPVAVRQLATEHAIRQVVAKLGREGVLVWDSSKHGPVPVPSETARVLDVTGAGDAFCGGFAAGLAAGLDVRTAARQGCVSAAFAIETSGSLALAAVTPGAAKARLAGVTDADAADPYAIDRMHEEIKLSATVVADQQIAARRAVEPVVRALVEAGIDNIYMVGCGDSDFAGAAAALSFARHTGVAAEAVHAIDMARYRVRYLPHDSAVICISSSGEVGRTIEAAAQARAAGHRVIALTGNPRSRLVSVADEVIGLDVPALGNTPGTISFLAMLTTLLELSLAWAQARGRSIDAARTALARAPHLIAQAVESCDDPSAALAGRLRRHSAICFIGAGPSDAMARFGAAKLVEGPQMRGLATNLEEWAHGEYFVTREGDPVIVIAPAGAASDRAAEILSELAFIGADSTLITDQPGAVTATTVLKLPAGLPEEFSPLVSSVPLGFLGYHLARLRGKRSYNFASPAIRQEHYDTIHRDTRGRPA